MKKENAIEISKWTYSDEYSIYSFHENEETIAELMNGDYYVHLDANQNLIGYVCFGKSARIPTAQDNIYTKDFLDIGLGLKPKLCGQGLGFSFLKNGISFAIDTFNKKHFRLTVTKFNQRAIKVYEKIGFKYQRTVNHKNSNNEFNIMVCTQ